MRIKYLKRVKTAVLIITIFFIMACVYLYSPFFKLAIESHMNMIQVMRLFINQNDCKKAEAIIENDKSIMASKAVQSIGKINEIYQLHDVFFLDFLSTVSNEELHIVWEYDNQNLKKFLDQTSCLIKNENNKALEKVEFRFNQLKGKEVDYYKIIDPFTKNNNGFIEKKREIGLCEYTYVPQLNRAVEVSVLETIAQPETLDCTFISYPKNTDIVTLAMDHQTTVSNISLWFSEAAFDSKGYLIEDSLLCIEKEFTFRYGRQVNIFDPNTGGNYLVIDEWENVNAKYSLQQPYLVNGPDDYIRYELLNPPESIRLCDLYYKEKAIQTYLSE